MTQKTTQSDQAKAEAEKAETAKAAAADKAAAEQADADKAAAEQAEAEAKRRAHLLAEVTAREGQPEAMGRLIAELVESQELVGIGKGHFGTITLCGIEARGADMAQAIRNWAAKCRRLALGLDSEAG